MEKDIEFVEEGVKIVIKRSKTDQSGEGLTKGIPYFSNSNYCPVIALKNWKERPFLIVWDTYLLSFLQNCHLKLLHWIHNIFDGSKYK